MSRNDQKKIIQQAADDQDFFRSWLVSMLQHSRPSAEPKFGIRVPRPGNEIENSGSQVENRGRKFV